MAITVYGRRAIRAIEQATGEQIVHATGNWATSVDHGHWEWARNMWWPLAWATNTNCGLNLASCRTLFGADESGARRHFMLGACDTAGCGAGPGERHRWDCPTLLDLLDSPSINPDYWPRPVHRPLWVDDPRRLARTP